ncbi:substrate-binding domain-containing protein [Streptomyces sp. SID6673]|nr:substrate-binding domain-containing protein [Streptomyces sp. SID11726]NDZ94716.1 substrate-binding domain-containing protein [Streptomyces sp. SID11726]NEB22876.1 substrate-binding domain-containing protein [Streptomyces sp. SID6673]
MHLGLVIPQSGPSGIFGPSCAASAQLAVEEMNEAGGVLGDEVRVTTIDGGGRADRVAATVARHIDAGAIDAVLGWHTSAVRRHLVGAIGGRIPYVYTAVYEGGESAPATFMTGEVPETQLIPAMTWMSDELGVRRWYIVGSDYVWPRTTVTMVVDDLTAHDSPARIVATEFLPLGTTDFNSTLDHIERSDATGILVLLLGGDAVAFNRSFGRRGLHERCVRLSPLMDENMLLGSGDDGAQQLFSASGYFESLATSESLEFEGRYVRRFGVCAPPLTSPGESCYEGLALLGELVHRAGSLNPAVLECAADKPFTYASPRGEVRFSGRHLHQDVYVARADGLEFDVVTQVTTA